MAMKTQLLVIGAMLVTTFAAGAQTINTNPHQSGAIKKLSSSGGVATGGGDSDVI